MPVIKEPVQAVMIYCGEGNPTTVRVKHLTRADTFLAHVYPRPRYCGHIGLTVVGHKAIARLKRISMWDVHDPAKHGPILECFDESLKIDDVTEEMLTQADAAYRKFVDEVDNLLNPPEVDDETSEEAEVETADPVDPDLPPPTDEPNVEAEVQEDDQRTAQVVAAARKCALTKGGKPKRNSLKAAIGDFTDEEYQLACDAIEG